MTSMFDRAGIVVHEQTPHRLAPPDSLREPPERPLEREDILPEGRAFVLRHVLSPAECEHFIAASEALGMRDSGYDRRVRRVDRVVALGSEVASLIYSRCREHFEPRPMPPARGKQRDGPRLRMQWRPDGLNPCFRVCRYEKGGVFFPHLDGVYEESAARRSQLTFMLYLNDVPREHGGATSFYDGRQRPYQPPDPQFVRRAYQPEAGSCIVFDHTLLHDGGALLGDAPKYIMRSEVMFRRGPVEEPPSEHVGVPSRLTPEAGLRALRQKLREGAVSETLLPAANST